jgi:hypothetical protein
MVLRVATIVLCLVCLLFTMTVSPGMASGPSACGPQPYSCSPAPCAPPPCPPPACGPSSPFPLCGGILGSCTSICGACIGIPAAIMSAILAPPRPRAACGPPPCPPPMCAPPACPAPSYGPPMCGACGGYGCAPKRITKCKPVSCAPSYGPSYGPAYAPAYAPSYGPYPPRGARVPLMMQMPRADYAPSGPPMGMLSEALEMPFRLISGVLTPLSSSYYGPFAGEPTAPTFGGYW